MIRIAAILLHLGLVSSQTLPCGVPTVTPATKRIVGGKESVPGSWPWMVMIVDDLDFISGGGAIIGAKTILTSAQHFSGAGYSPSTINLNQWEVFLGSHSISKDGPNEKSYRIASVKVHEQFDQNSLLNDVALVFLNETIAFNDHTRPVCLGDAANKYSTGQTCYLAGWGSTSSTGNEDVLNQVDIPILADSVCQQHWSDFIAASEICAGYEGGGKDFCSDDVGNPLVCQGSNTAWFVQGIASSGGDCTLADEPGIYEDVSTYNAWIKAAMAAAGDPYQY